MFCHFLPRVARDRNEEARENYARRGVYMSVLHMKLISPPMYIQHNPCPCRCLLERRALRPQTIETEIHIENTAR